MSAPTSPSPGPSSTSFQTPAFSATNSSMLDVEIVLCALGLALIMEGIPYFGFPGAVKKVLTEVVPSLPVGALRLLGLGSMLLGLLLVYLGRQ